MEYNNFRAYATGATGATMQYVVEQFVTFSTIFKSDTCFKLSLLG